MNLKLKRNFSKLEKIFNEFRLKVYRRRLENKDVTIISRDCIGGFLYHQYGLRFLSPTINLYFKLPEFNYFCLNLKEYLYGNITQIFDNDKNYPIGLIEPKSPNLPAIRVNFMHYASFEEAVKKWNERRERINWNNIYIINHCITPSSAKLVDDDLIEKFNRIPYKKMIFVRQKYGFSNEFIFNNPEDLLVKKKHSFKYNFNEFNFNNFFNEK